MELSGLNANFVKRTNWLFPLANKFNLDPSHHPGNRQISTISPSKKQFNVQY